MAAVITVVSSDDEDDVEIVAEIAPTSLEVKRELTIRSVECKNDAGILRSVTSTLLTTSVTISKVKVVCSNGLQDIPPVNGDSHLRIENCKSVTDEDSDDEIICLGTNISTSDPVSNTEPKFSIRKNQLQDLKSKEDNNVVEAENSDDEIICLGTQDSNVQTSVSLPTNLQGTSTQDAANTNSEISIRESQVQDLKLEEDNKAIDAENSDDEIICLGTQDSNVDKSALLPTNHQRASTPDATTTTSGDRIKLKKEVTPNLEKNELLPIVISLDDEDDKMDEKPSDLLSSHAVNDNSSIQEVVFIDSGEGSDEDSRDFIFTDGDKAELSESFVEKETDLEFTQSKDDPINSNADPQPSCSAVQAEVDIEASPNGPGNLTEKLLKQLITKVGNVGLEDKPVNCIKKKIMRYYNAAPLDFTQSEHFIVMVKNVTTEVSRLYTLPNNKDLPVLQEITDKLKEFLNAFQRSSTNVTVKLGKLYRMWEKLKKRIQRLEVTDVESDSEYEDSYEMLGRYRKKACLVYDKICELEGKANHANRHYKQQFIYVGVGPIPIQRALERYYNETNNFPDFLDVYNLVKRVNVEQKLNLTPSQAHITAQEVFSDFGKKLKCRRQVDDYLVSRTYLPLETRDPAEIDEALQNKLISNRKLAKKESDILSKFVLEQANLKSDKSEDNENGDASSDKTGSEESGDEEEGSVTVRYKNAFIDSDEEMAYLENIEPTPQPIENGPPSKKCKISSSKRDNNPSR